MKSILFKLLLAVLILPSCAQEESQAQNASNKSEVSADNQWILDDLVTKWENNQKYTLGLLKAMPAEHYGFVPAEGMRSFEEQAVHMAGTINMQLTKIGHPGLPELKGGSKEEILKAYVDMFKETISYLKQMKGAVLSEETPMWYGSSTKNRILNLMDNHLAHHRGQMIVYIRLKGLEPPSYIGW